MIDFHFIFVTNAPIQKVSSAAGEKKTSLFRRMASRQSTSQKRSSSADDTFDRVVPFNC